MQDLVDLRHDQDPNLTEDKRFKDCQTTCQAKTWHDWDGQRSAMICPTCTKRDGKNKTTVILEELYAMKRGGMPIERAELPAEVWQALGEYDAYASPRIF